MFKEISEVFILIPALVGLKGNLEMTLASRLSTAANTGQLDNPKQQMLIASTNLAGVQVQATVMSSLAALVAVGLGAWSKGSVDLQHAAVLSASGVTTAFVSALSLGLVMVGVIIGSRKLGINPDNVATPIAASLGDIITLSLLAEIGSFFYRFKDMWYVLLLICAVFFLLIPLWLVIACRSSSIRELLRSGWYPVIIAMLISRSEFQVCQSSSAAGDSRPPSLPLYSLPAAGWPCCHQCYFHLLLPVCSTTAGADTAVRGRCVGAANLATWSGPRQFCHPLSDCTGRPAGHQLSCADFQSNLS
ncbi:solute carrier family 41 member 3-like isoform X3 [Trichomycterus rosablanca]|uniref:solute carrier family 41 member 3-like isoform X3 n=1 Tax=Trichomycterus rosablanca TaxID=2290929 RepID=UPI002F35AC6A